MLRQNLSSPSTIFILLTLRKREKKNRFFIVNNIVYQGKIWTLNSFIALQMYRSVLGNRGKQFERNSVSYEEQQWWNSDWKTPYYAKGCSNKNWVCIGIVFSGNWQRNKNIQKILFWKYISYGLSFSFEEHHLLFWKWEIYCKAV